jgi:hypothetical protein
VGLHLAQIVAWVTDPTTCGKQNAAVHPAIAAVRHQLKLLRPNGSQLSPSMNASIGCHIPPAPSDWENR